MKIKLISILLVISAVLCLFGVSCRSDDKNAEEGNEYVFNSNNFSLFVPNDWTVTLASDVLSARASDGSSVTLSVFDYTTDELMTIDLAWKKISENFPTFFDGNYSIDKLSEEESSTSLGRLPAMLYRYSGKTAAVDMRYEEILTLYETRVIQLVFSSKEELFDSHTEEFEKIREYFSFSGDKAAPSGWKKADKPEVQLYSSGKFSVEINRDWITDSSTGVLSARYANGFPSSISFMIAEKPSDFSDLETYWNSFSKQFEESFKSFAIDETSIYHGKEDEIGGRKARQFVFTAIPAVDTEGNDVTYKYCQVLIELDNDIIIATYSSSASSEKGEGYFDTHFEIFRNVLDTFKVTEK